MFLDLVCISMIESFIDYFNSKSDDLNFLIKTGCILIGAKIISTFIHRQYQMFENNLALKSTLRLNCFIFDKILKTSPSSNEKRSSQGEIINFIQVDGPKLGYMLIYCPFLFIYPLQIIVYLILLFHYLGVSFSFGVIPLFMFLIINFFIFKKYANFENELLEKKDIRMEVTTETFESLKLLKMYAWEEEFQKRVNIILLFLC